MHGAELKKALHDGRRVYGTCVTSTSPHWPAMIAACGVDFVFIDTEHVAIERAQLSWMCQAYGARGLAPIVRIPCPDPYRACMVLDGGAAGVVAPYVERVEEVQQLRGAVRFRPLKGQRLRDVLEGRAILDEETAAYLEAKNRDTLCIINIESTAALEALEGLAAVPGLDALLIGPHDLSISLGIPEQYTHPRFTEAIERIIAAGRGAGIGVGYHFGFGIDAAIDWARRGANLIIHSTDLFLVRNALKADLTRFREALGDAGSGHADKDAQPFGDDITV